MCRRPTVTRQVAGRRAVAHPLIVHAGDADARCPSSPSSARTSATTPVHRQWPERVIAAETLEAVEARSSPWPVHRSSTYVDLQVGVRAERHRRVGPLRPPTAPGWRLTGDGGHAWPAGSCAGLVWVDADRPPRPSGTGSSPGADQPHRRPSTAVAGAGLALRSSAVSLVPAVQAPSRPPASLQLTQRPRNLAPPRSGESGLLEYPLGHPAHGRQRGSRIGSGALWQHLWVLLVRRAPIYPKEPIAIPDVRGPPPSASSRASPSVSFGGFGLSLR